ncbi:hypothetical protein FCM35_KLT16742 [Carex littledalei]|uniref:Uncharacterized protein n=1 Tax=Carex littledalei TaxID=544730 RepID=A0A833RHQ0_9POAL|nr:hypothetical protein FCM35_KLT16742 [Carex littledalei]
MRNTDERKGDEEALWRHASGMVVSLHNFLSLAQNSDVVIEARQGHPSGSSCSDKIIQSNLFLNEIALDLATCFSKRQVPGHVSQPNSLTDVTMQVSELNAVLAAEKAKEEILKKEIDELRESIWGADVENLSLEELNFFSNHFFKQLCSHARVTLFAKAMDKSVVCNNVSHANTLFSCHPMTQLKPKFGVTSK